METPQPEYPSIDESAFDVLLRKRQEVYEANQSYLEAQRRFAEEVEAYPERRYVVTGFPSTVTVVQASAVTGEKRTVTVHYAALVGDDGQNVPTVFEDVAIVGVDTRRGTIDISKEPEQGSFSTVALRNVVSVECIPFVPVEEQLC